MALLIMFAFIAGAATALSPCVLPVLPVALAAGATGVHRRPLGVVTGLTLSFTFATVALVYVLSAPGLPDDLFRSLAIAVLAVAGLALIVPGFAARLEAALSRLVWRPRAAAGDGFGSGVGLGASLGLVYVPCAGPILADRARGATPETYLGVARAERFVNRRIGPGMANFRLQAGSAAALPPHHLAYQGRWRIRESYATADEDGARLHLRFFARRVYLVLGSRSGDRHVGVAIKGHPRRTVAVGPHRLYELVRLPRPGDHPLTLTFERGTEAYAFTFG